MFKVPIQALVPLTEDRTGCWGPAGLRGSIYIAPIQALVPLTEDQTVVVKSGSSYILMTTAGLQPFYLRFLHYTLIYIGWGFGVAGCIRGAMKGWPSTGRVTAASPLTTKMLFYSAVVNI